MKKDKMPKRKSKSMRCPCGECKAKDDCTMTCKEYKIWRRSYLGGIHGTGY